MSQRKYILMSDKQENKKPEQIEKSDRMWKSHWRRTWRQMLNINGSLKWEWPKGMIQKNQLSSIGNH